MKAIFLFYILKSVYGQIGGDRDEHGCLIAGGYTWCESLNQCIRPFETTCPPTPTPTPTPTPHYKCYNKKYHKKKHYKQRYNDDKQHYKQHYNDGKQHQDNRT